MHVLIYVYDQQHMYMIISSELHPLSSYAAFNWLHVLQHLYVFVYVIKIYTGRQLNNEYENSKHMKVYAICKFDTCECLDINVYVYLCIYD
jgi:hypothetical protein